MKKPKSERIETLERALRCAYHSRTDPVFPEHWTDDVMRDVRNQPDREDIFVDASRFIWRAAAVIALVSALLLGSVLTWTARQTESDFSELLTMAIDDSTLWDR